MRDLRELIEKDGRESLLPFLDAYIKITEGVIDEKSKGHFEEPDKLTELDIRFAELYLDAMKAYLEGGEKKQPWKTYLDYIERDNSKPVVELLLGINAHINSDLTQVLWEQEYDNLNDFKQINLVLRRSLYPVMVKIGVERHDVELFTLMGALPMSWTGLKRVQSWRSYSLKNSKKPNFNLEEIRELTEKNAKNIIELRHEHHPLRMIRKPFKAMKTGVKI